METDIQVHDRIRLTVAGESGRLRGLLGVIEKIDPNYERPYFVRLDGETGIRAFFRFHFEKIEQEPSPVILSEYCWMHVPGGWDCGVCYRLLAVNEQKAQEDGQAAEFYNLIAEAQ